jgi:hypothetical protein
MMSRNFPLSANSHKPIGAISEYLIAESGGLDVTRTKGWLIMPWEGYTVFAMPTLMGGSFYAHYSI